MSIRSLVAVLVAVASIPGCGLGLRHLAGEPHFWVFTETTSYEQPALRVALATLEAMRLELASADLAAGREPRLAIANLDVPVEPGRKIPGPGEPIPPDELASRVDWTARPDADQVPNLVILLRADFDGRTRDGQPVRVTVARGQASTVTIRVGRRGDPEVSRALAAQIADRLAHPLHPPGSPGEAETLRAFFGGAESREAIPTLRKPAP